MCIILAEPLRLLFKEFYFHSSHKIENNTPLKITCYTVCICIIKYNGNDQYEKL